MTIKIACRLLLSGLVFLCLTACQPLSAPPPATLQTISLSYTPAVSAWRPVFSSCASGLPGIGLVVDEFPASKMSQALSDVILSAGVSPGLESSYSIDLGQDPIVVLVQSANPVIHLTLQDLTALYSGKVQTWDALSTASGHKSPGRSLPVQIWSYPDGDELRNSFDQAAGLTSVGIAAPSSSNRVVIYTAPDPQAVIQAVGQNPGAIGYVLSSSLSVSQEAKQVHPVTMDASASSLLNLSIVASLKTAPQGAVRQLLLCVQGNRPTPKVFSPP